MIQSNGWLVDSCISFIQCQIDGEQLRVVNKAGHLCAQTIFPRPAETPTLNLASSLCVPSKASDQAPVYVTQGTLAIKLKHKTPNIASASRPCGRSKLRRLRAQRGVLVWGCGHSSPDNVDLWVDPTLENMSSDSGTDSLSTGPSHQQNARKSASRPHQKT
jgi:hypothetical protein